MPTSRLRFRGAIAGVGTTSGVRFVVGHWDATPFGAFDDVMVEDAGGHRMLLAPNPRIGEFVSATYGFDEVRLAPVSVRTSDDVWHVVAGELRLRIDIGGPTAFGRLLAIVPRRLSGTVGFAVVADPVARVVLRGVRTSGTAGNGRREWYSAHGVRAIAGVSGMYAGSSLGGLAPVDPPVSFGFGSTPRQPCVTEVTTTVELSEP